MGKVLKCRDVGVECDFEAHGESESEILQKAAVHAQECHQDITLTPELAEKIKGAIKDEGGSCCS